MKSQTTRSDREEVRHGERAGNRGGDAERGRGRQRDCVRLSQWGKDYRAEKLLI